MLLRKIKNKFRKMRLQPISVYCLHHVCKSFDENSMNDGDWMSVDDFRTKINTLLNSGIRFISLPEAYKHISKDLIRLQKYAVITFDDGYASIKEILPWLEENRIPVTLFVNGKYLDGISYRNKSSEKYLTKEEIFSLDNDYIEIGHHGWEHTDVTKMPTEEFIDSTKKNIEILNIHNRYIPFFAYTWGKHNKLTDIALKKINIIPVLMDGMKNYNEKSFIHRELLSI